MENKGQGKYTLKALPLQAQLAPYYAAATTTKGWIMLGNYYDANIQMGLYDADHGFEYRWKDNKFEKKSLLSQALTSQFRKIVPIKGESKMFYVLIPSRDKVVVLEQ